MRIDRMLGIIVLLLNRDRVNARHLAERFEVSVRTIYRDIEAINMAGIPIVAHVGNNGGFGIMDNYRIDRQVLTLSDMTSIVTALKGVSPTIDDNGYDNVTEKILSLIPTDKIDEMKERFDELCIDIMPWGYKEKTKELLKEIQQAISNRKVIRFDYRNNKREAINRMVEPMTLVYKGYAWYLFGYCKIRNNFRIFKLVRMNNLVTTSESFKRRKESYQDYLKYNQDEIKKVDLVLWYSKDIMPTVEEYFEECCIEYNQDGSAIVRVSLPEDEWLYNIILGNGDNVKVLEPKHIARAIKEKAEKILSLYKHDIMVSQF